MTRTRATSAGPGRGSRRAFLRTTALSGAVLVLDIGRLFPSGRAEAGGEAEPKSFAPGPLLRIDSQGKVSITVGKSEMGQGVRTSLPMILAEELEIDPSQVALVQARAGGDVPDMTTAGSTSVSGRFLPLRKAGAAAREMLITAAAASWGVSRESCQAAAGHVVHTASGRRISYGRLVEAASALEVPKDPSLKDEKDFRLLGRRVGITDGAAVANGTAIYTLDVRVPGMLYAAVARCPVLGGTPGELETARVLAMPGVRNVVRMASGVAVVAASTWQALKARDALASQIRWNEGPHASFSSAGFRKELDAALQGPATAARRDGDPETVLAGAAQRIAATYEFPFEAHAPMEPVCALASVAEGRCEIWAGTQSPEEAQRAAAALLGIEPQAVAVNVTLLGGGFGRRLATDFILEAVELSRTAKAPVQTIWTRSDDLRNGAFHPASLHRLEAGLDPSGSVIAWRHRIAAPSLRHVTGQARKETLAAFETQGATLAPYALGAMEVDYAEVPTHVPLGFWRGASRIPNIVAMECFLDEIAAATGKDPLALRRALLMPARRVTFGKDAIDTGRLLNVLETAADRAGWARPLAKGRFRGLACWAYGGRTHLAHVVEISLLPGRERRVPREVRIERVVTAVDCGVVVNPSGVDAQVEGGVVFGLTAALKSRITFDKGRVREGTLREFPILRLDEMPKVEVYRVPSAAPPSGMGEAPVPPIVAAVLNAVSAATGTRVRRLPVDPPTVF